MKIHFTTASLSDKIGKLESGRDPHVCELKCALKKFESTVI
jgi:hypothetical protein